MNVIIHIGNHKTGTKTLQRNFFSKLKKVKFLGDPYTPGSEIEELFERIKYQDILSYDISKSKDLFEKIKLSLHLQYENQPVLISDESLVTPFFGGKMTADPAVIANRIKELFKKVKILYVIRSQLTMLPSLYTQFVSPEFISQKDFVERINIQLKNQLHGMMHALRYDKICNYYINLFGKENFKLIPYELLVNEPKKYYHEICNFLGEPCDENFINKFVNIKEHERRSKGTVVWEKISLKYERFRESYNLDRIKKYLPFLSTNKIKYLLSEIIFRKPITIEIPSNLQKMIYDFYAPSNFRLQKIFNIDLKKYGYPLIPSYKETRDIEEMGLKGWSVRRY